MPTKAPVAAADCPSLEVGGSVYYKIARDLLDDGQFGPAYVLTAFNYDRAYNFGVELKATFKYGNFSADANWAWARPARDQGRVQPVPVRPGRAGLHRRTIGSTPTTSRLYTGSAGSPTAGPTPMLVDGTTASATLIFGSGLRTPGWVVCPNSDHLPSYSQVNIGVSHDFAHGAWNKPITVRFDVVNLFDKIYEIRDGTGIGVFAPQFGPRRGYYFGISQKLGSPEKTAGSCPASTPRPQPRPRSPTIGTAPMSAPISAARSAPESTCSRPIGWGATNPSGALGGLQFGYNYLAAPNWLVGIEGELGWTSAQGKANFVDPAGTASLSITSDHNWYDTLSRQGRLCHGTADALRQGRRRVDECRLPHGGEQRARRRHLANTTRSGWTAGGGLEYMLGSHWSAKLEYDHLAFGSKTLSFVNPFGNSVTVESSINQVKAGVNYHLEGLL